MAPFVTSLRERIRAFAYAHIGGTALVLIYHRIADLDRDPQLLAVSPDNFSAQMDLLAEKYRVVPIAELLGSVRRRSVPLRAVAITFDDGYADNLHAAQPILASRNLPATVFVSSGYVEAQREFWWDELERLVLAPGTLPDRIALETPVGSFSASVADPLDYSAEDARRDAGWTVLEPDTNARQALYRDLAAFLRPLPPLDREMALDRLRALACPEDAPTCEVPRATHRPLTALEVTALAASPGIEIGGHTDARGSDAANQELSQKRAQAVRDYLVGKFPNLSASQYTAKGYGESKPIAGNDSEMGRAKNRRVEFTVLNREVLRKEIERRKTLKHGKP